MTTFRDTLPRPLAIGLHAVENALPGELGPTLQKFVELLVRYAVLVDLARYVSLREEGQADLTMEDGLAGWSKPSFGDWVGYLRTVQAGLKRLSTASTLPGGSTQLDGAALVDFRKRVRADNSPKVTLSQFLDAVVQWRNAGGHGDAIQRHSPESEVLRRAVAELLDQCPDLLAAAPIWVESSQFIPGRSGKPDQLDISYFTAVGTSPPLRARALVGRASAFGPRELYLCRAGLADPLPLKPFFQWGDDQEELLMLGNIDRNQATFTAPRITRPDPTEDLRSAAGFLFSPARTRAQAAGHAPTTPANPALAAYTTMLEASLLDGVFTPDERATLESMRKTLGLSREDADQALAAHGVMDDRHRADAVAAPLPTPEVSPTAASWDVSARALLRGVREHVRTRLAFSFLETSGDDQIDEDGLLLFRIDDRHGLSVWFESKYRDTVKVVLQFFGKAPDPAFAEARRLIEACHPTLPQGWEPLARSEVEHLCLESRLRTPVAQLESAATHLAVAEAVLRLSCYIAEYLPGVRARVSEVGAGPAREVIAPPPVRPTSRSLPSAKPLPLPLRAALHHVKAHQSLGVKVTAQSSDADIEVIAMDNGSLDFKVDATHSLSLWFHPAADCVYAVLGWYGPAGAADPTWSAVRDRLEQRGAELWPGWEFRRASWKPAAYEAYHKVAPQLDGDQLGLFLLRALTALADEVVLAGGGEPAALPGRTPMEATADLLGYGVDLQLELTTIADRAVKEDFAEAGSLLGIGPTPAIRRNKKTGIGSDGREGVDVMPWPWKPGVFCGVLVDGRDHRTTPGRSRLGVDFVVILSMYQKVNPGAYESSPAFQALRARLAADHGRWDFHDHLAAVPRPNRWHPIHLRRPLVEVWEGAGTPEARCAAWLAAAREGMELLLRGGEARDLSGAWDEPPSPAHVETSEPPGCELVPAALAAEPSTVAAPGEPAPAVGEGAPDSGAFQSGFDRNREFLGRPQQATVERRVWIDKHRGYFIFHTQRLAGDRHDRSAMLAWHSSLPTAYCVRHGMASRYLDQATMAALGVPTEDERGVVSITGVRAAVQTFKVGDPQWLHRSLCYHLDGAHAGKAFFTRGGIHAKYVELGAEQSALGLPTSDEEKTDDGAVSRFERGEIRWTRKTGAIRVDVPRR